MANYERAAMEITEFETEDIVTTSMKICISDGGGCAQYQEECWD